MNRIKVAFDIDGTLRCNCTETCQDPNKAIVELFRILGTFKNVDLFVWSGSGAERALEYAQRYRLKVSRVRCISKDDAPAMDIAIDDQQEFALATLNLIVREK